jgi:hypothetical protein
MMKHIREGFDRICRTPVPQDDGYMTDAEWRKLPECPVCFGKHQPTLAKQERKVQKQTAPPQTVRQGLYLRQYARRQR